MTLKEIMRGFLNEGVSNDEINDAIDNHKYVVITYEGDDGTHNGKRMIEPVAYGCTTAGYPVIRAFERFGDTKTSVPKWKYLRVDRISSWKETDKTFSEPAELFNPNDDKTMSIVYKIAKFDNSTSPVTPNAPKLKKDEKPQVFKTDSELKMNKLKKQLENPLTLGDFKTQDAFRDVVTPKETEGPKTNKDVKKGTDSVYSKDYNYNVFDDSLNAANKNPNRIGHYRFQNRDKFGRFSKGYVTDEPQVDDTADIEDYLNRDNGNNIETIEDLRKVLGDTSEPISLQDLKDKLRKK